MSILVVGLSYKSASVSVLESASVSTDDVPKLLDELRTAPAISEVLLLSTCNRIEIYADVARFHPALAEISSVLRSKTYRLRLNRHSSASAIATAGQ